MYICTQSYARGCKYSAGVAIAGVATTGASDGAYEP